MMRLTIAVLYLVAISVAVEETTDASGETPAPAPVGVAETIPPSPDATGADDATAFEPIAVTGVPIDVETVTGNGDSLVTTAPVATAPVGTTVIFTTFATTPAPTICRQPLNLITLDRITELLDETFDSPQSSEKTKEFEEFMNRYSPKQLKAPTAEAIWTLYKEFRALTDGKDTPLPYHFKEGFRGAMVSKTREEFRAWLDYQWANEVEADLREKQKKIEAGIQNDQFSHIFKYLYAADPGNMSYFDFLYWELYCIQPNTTTLAGTVTVPTATVPGPVATETPAPEGPTAVPATDETDPATGAASAATGAPATTAAVTDVPSTASGAPQDPTVPTNGSVDPCHVPQSVLAAARFWLDRPYANYSRLEAALSALPKKVDPVHAQFLMSLARELQKAANHGFHSNGSALFRELVYAGMSQYNVEALKGVAEDFWCNRTQCEQTEQWKKFELDILPAEYTNFFLEKEQTPSFYEYLEGTFGIEHCIYTCPPLSDYFVHTVEDILEDSRGNDPRIDLLLVERSSRSFVRNFPVLVEMARILLRIVHVDNHEFNLFKYLVYVASDQQPHNDLVQIATDYYGGQLPLSWRYIEQTAYHNAYQTILGRPYVTDFYIFLKETFANPEQCRPGQAPAPRLTTRPPPTLPTPTTPTPAGPSNPTAEPDPGTVTDPILGVTATGIPTIRTTTGEPTTEEPTTEEPTTGKPTTTEPTTSSTTTPKPTTSTTTVPSTTPAYEPDFGIFGSIVAIASKCPDYSGAYTIHKLLVSNQDPTTHCIPSVSEIHVLLCLSAFYKEHGQDDFLAKLHAKTAEMALHGYDRYQIRNYISAQMERLTDDEYEGYQEVTHEAEEAFPKIVQDFLGPSYPQGQTIEEFVDTYIGCSVRTTLCQRKGNQSLAVTTAKVTKILTDQGCVLRQKDVNLWVYLYEFLAQKLEFSCDTFLTHIYSNIIELAISNVGSQEIEDDYAPRQWKHLSHSEYYIMRQFSDHLIEEFHHVYDGDLTLTEVIRDSMDCPGYVNSSVTTHPPSIIPTIPTIPPQPITTTPRPVATWPTVLPPADPTPGPLPGETELQHICYSNDVYFGGVDAVLDLLCPGDSGTCLDLGIQTCLKSFVQSKCSDACIYKTIAKVMFTENEQERVAVTVPPLLDSTPRLHGLAQLFLNVYQTLAKKQTAADPGAWTVIKEYLHTFFPNIAATGLGVTDTAAVLQGVPLTEEHFFPQLKSYLDNQFNKNIEEWQHSHIDRVVKNIMKVHVYAMRLLGREFEQQGSGAVSPPVGPRYG